MDVGKDVDQVAFSTGYITQPIEWIASSYWELFTNLWRDSLRKKAILSVQLAKYLPPPKKSSISLPTQLMPPLAALTKRENPALQCRMSVATTTITQIRKCVTYFLNEINAGREKNNKAQISLGIKSKEREEMQK